MSKTKKTETLNIVLDHRELKEIMAAIQNLTQSITDLTTAVSNIPQAGSGGTTPTGATEEQVQAAADAVNAQTAIINQKLTPPATS